MIGNVTLYFTLFTVMLFHHIHGRFPVICGKNVTEGTGVCCPVPSGFTEPCGGPGRGFCGVFPEVNLNYHPRVDPLAMDLDDRFNWPHKHINRGCQCEANYFGYDCSLCKYGFTGRDCSEKEVFIRKNVVKYTAKEKKILIDTLLASKTALSNWGVLVSNNNGTDEFIELTVWDLFQFSHFRSTQRLQDSDQCRPVNYDFAHSGPGFLPWHRKFMLWIERELRMLSEDKSFALPYWDWVGADHCEVCTNDLMGTVLSDGTIHPDSPLSQWRTICEINSPCRCDPREDAGPLTRTLGSSPGARLPSVAEAEFSLRPDIYDSFPYSRQTSNSSFRLVVEGGPDGFSGMHNGVHFWVGGSMSNSTTSGNDPIFLLHHTFIDKLFEVWLRKNQQARNQFPTAFGPVGHLALDPMVPFYPPEYNIDYYNVSSTFGYEFDTLSLSYENGNGGNDEWDLWQYIALAAAGVVIVVLICVIFCCFCRSKHETKPNKQCLQIHIKDSDTNTKETASLLPK